MPTVSAYFLCIGKLNKMFMNICLDEIMNHSLYYFWLLGSVVNEKNICFIRILRKSTYL